MALLLAIETSADQCSIALSVGAEIVERRVDEPRGHNRLLLPAIDAVLGEGGCRLAQLDAIAVGVGPGSFTGLRIGIGVAQGLAFGSDLGVIPVSSLAALAQAGVRAGVLSDDDIALPAVDARMGQIYWGLYRRVGALVTAVREDSLDAPARVDEVAAPLVGSQVPVALGGGWDLEGGPQLRARRGYGSLAAFAIDILRLAEPLYAAGALLPPERLEPRYLRGSDHWRRQRP